MGVGIYQKQRQNLDIRGLVNSIAVAVTNIDSGRKGFAIRGKEQEGRISYEDGISEAMTIFQKIQISADPEALVFAEFAFVTQEFQSCDKTDANTINSLTKAIESFKDAILALNAVKKSGYQIAEDIFPHDKKYRVKGFPKDSFHIACASHQTRIRNILSSPGIDPIEKALLKQRLSNMATAQSGYIEKQKKAMSL